MDLKYIENMKFNEEVFLNLQKFVSKDIESLYKFNCSSIGCDECPFSCHNRGIEVNCCAIDKSDLRDIGEYYLVYFKGEMSKEDLGEMSKEDLGEMSKEDLVKVLVPGNIVEVNCPSGTHLGVVLSNSQVMYLDAKGFDRISELLKEHEDYYINRVFEPIEGTTKESILQLEKLNCVYSRNTIKHPKDVPFGERYEMYYNGERYECRNELLFGKEIIHYRRESDGTSFAVPISWVGEKGIESIKLITD